MHEALKPTMESWYLMNNGPLLTREQFEYYMERAENSPTLAIDTEGYFEFDNKLLDVSQCVGVSFAGPGFETYLPFNHLEGWNLPGEWQARAIKTLSATELAIFHNAKHDLNALSKLGIKIDKFFCTLLGTHMVDENIPNKGLDYVSVMSGGEPKRRPELMQKIINVLGWAYVPSWLMYEYGSWDARITYDYFEWLYPQFRAQGFTGELWDNRQKFTRIVGAMEQRGIAINCALSTEELEFGEKRLAAISNELCCNPASPKDLSRLLLENLGLPVVKRTKNKDNPKPSFDREAMEIYDEMLERLDNPTARLIKEYRGWQKTTSSNYRPYLERLSSDGRLRCNYKLHGTVSGRLSCNNPNLQQIPKVSDRRWNGRLKAAFIGQEGYNLYEGDYSQLEFRLAAAAARDQALIDIFNDADRDIFSEMADQLRMGRSPVKTLNYSLQYGAGVERIRHVFGVTWQEAKGIRDNYYKTYPLLKKATDRAANKVKQQGYITLFSGRRRHFTDPDRMAHKAFNAWCQGGAADIVEQTMIRIEESGILGDECRMLLQVHDSLVFEIADGREGYYKPILKDLMEAIPQDFGVKFKVDMHKWGE